MGDEMDEEDVAAIEAIRAVRKYLAEAWIVEGCRTHPTMGCASCEVVDLDRRLEMLAAEIQENAGFAPHVS